MPNIELDKTDLKILAALQKNGRLTNVELAEKVALSPSPCLRRLKQLEDSGVIRQYVALLEPGRIGLGLQAFVRVALEKRDAETIGAGGKGDGTGNDGLTGAVGSTGKAGN